MKTEPVPIGRPSFLAAPRCDDLTLLAADLAIVGIPYTTPDNLQRSRSACSPAPAAIREQSLRLADSLGHYDFDLGGELFAGRRVRLADCGNVAMLPGRYEENSCAATDVIRSVVDRGALPIVLGGDPAATIPAVRGCADGGPICVVRIGAELDWRDEVDGVRESRYSAMRRASELPWVTGLLQVGLRGLGNARQREVDDAETFGSILVRAEEVQYRGVDAILRRLPPAASYYVSLDAAGLDPSIAPGVEEPAFGGLSYYQATNLLKGIAARGRVVGFDLVGIAPERDLNDLTSLLGVRLILNLVGALAHAGRLGTPPADPVSVASRAATTTAPARELVASSPVQ